MMTALVLVMLAGPPEPFLRVRAVGDVMLGTTVPEGNGAGLGFDIIELSG